MLKFSKLTKLEYASLPYILSTIDTGGYPASGFTIIVVSITLAVNAARRFGGLVVRNR